MSQYIIVSDATLDLPIEIVNRYDIKVIPMVFDIDNVTYHHYPDEREISIESFYEKLKTGATSVSSQISPLTYEEFFTPYLEQGLDILYIAFTSGLSGTCNTGRLVINQLSEMYPDRKILIIDSLCASIGEGLLVMNAAQRREQGATITELYDWTISHCYNARHWFTVKDLFHLRRGGRVSSVEALVGTALKICPVLSVDKEGKLAVISKVRGPKKEMEFLLNKLEEEGENLSEQTIIVGHGDNLEQAKALRDLILERFTVNEIIISKIGPIIGTHTGPGMLALTFLGKA